MSVRHASGDSGDFCFDKIRAGEGHVLLESDMCERGGD